MIKLCCFIEKVATIKLISQFDRINCMHLKKKNRSTFLYFFFASAIFIRKRVCYRLYFM